MSEGAVPLSHRVDRCRLCGGQELELVLPLGKSPVSEKYLTSENLATTQERVSLDLYFCHRCGHVQLLDVVNPEFLWADFTFRTGDNKALIEHFEDYVDRVIRFCPLGSGDLVLDIGSNDGTLLKAFARLAKCQVLGIDPAEEIAREAIADDVTTIIGYMNEKSAQDIKEEFGRAKIVTANNVFAHADDLSGMTRAIADVLDDAGVFIFEVSYLLDVVEHDLLGTIFHEHLSYHSVSSIKPFLERHGLELVRVDRGPEQGGSIVCFAQKIGGPHQSDMSVESLLTLEDQAGLGQASTMKEMFARLEVRKKRAREFISTAENEGKIVAGFGAARAGTTLLSYFEIGKGLAYLVDDNKSKHNKFSPGDKLEVLPTHTIYEKKPDYLIMLAWLHADKIIQRHPDYLKQGGKFVRVFPKFEVISLSDDVS